MSIQGCRIYVRFELLCIPFADVIAGSYKKVAAHPSQSDMYVCDLCNRIFSTQGSLKRHRESVHCQSGGFSYQVCGKRFYRKDVLQRHMKTHQPAVLFGHSAACPTDATVDFPPPPPSPPPKRHDETPVCDVCDLVRKRRRGIDRPFIVNLAAFRVEYATDAFTEESTLRSITSSKHGDEEYEAPASYRCSICQKSFHYRGNLREHLKTHPAATSSPPTSPVSPLAPAASGFAPMHERVRPCYRPAYQRIADSAIATTGLRFVSTNRVESAS